MKSDSYKLKEEEHYNSYFTDEKEYEYSNYNNISNKDKVNFAARQCIESKASELLIAMGEGKILDYGCSIGEKTYLFSSKDWEITGIDISANSISVANKLREKYNLNAKYIVMDCEDLSFPDKTFDIVYDFGTLSSLRLDIAIEEICRVLNPKGSLLAIETLGNNPIFKIKRKFNRMTGSRTSWAVDHILKMKDIESIKGRFVNSEVKYFSLTTVYLNPLLYLIPKKKHYSFISFFDKIDEYLLRFRMFQYLSFKVVIILSNPKKAD